MPVKAFIHAHWPSLSIAATAVAILIAIVAMVQTMPPRTIVMATGAPGGAYHEIGKRYQEILAREGVRLQLRQSAGSLENLALLRDQKSGVSVALVQGGLTSEAKDPELESLGAVFFEPLWIFKRRGLDGAGPAALHGKKISIGPQGSGNRALSIELLKRAGLDAQNTELLPFPPQEAAQKLLAGEIDALLLLASWDSPVVRALLADERAELISLRNVDAYIAHYPFLSKVTVPAGVGDLAKGRPPGDVTLLAAKASLVVRSDAHSALQFLLLNTAVQVHAAPGIFQQAARFPAAEVTDLPLSDEALQFYKTGRPFLQNVLPFWAAALAVKLLVIIIPLVGILYPLMKFLPALYGWAMRRKITRLYGELRLLEDEMERGRAGQDAGALAAQLDRLEQRANRVRIPAAYASMLYMLRNHIALVRERLGAQ